ncbi:hypothetical protein BD408DRAFT_423321 [Parasitella parasitica]|nr:hypothetical protein BD408DRAFT_423321 [Parasitella parasitica]
MRLTLLLTTDQNCSIRFSSGEYRLDGLSLTLRQVDMAFRSTSSDVIESSLVVPPDMYYITPRSAVTLAKAFIPWWRLLHDRISHHFWLHRIVPDKVPSSMCALCGIDTEDHYHFAVGCSFEADYWREVVSLLSLQDPFSSSIAIWTALTSFVRWI